MTWVNYRKVHIIIYVNPMKNLEPSDGAAPGSSIGTMKDLEPSDGAAPGFSHEADRLSPDGAVFEPNHEYY